MRILLISDIHGNYPALQAVEQQLLPDRFDHIINCGDSLVYGPFPNESLEWLQQNNALSILGNTDKKVIKLLTGKDFAKPSKPEKRVMYTHCAAQLSQPNRDFLCALPKKSELRLPAQPVSSKKLGNTAGIFHGSPVRHHEFLFDTTPLSYFEELSDRYPYRLILTGHSHTPYHIIANGTHFINPGSVGRMFDGNPAASCTVILLDETEVQVTHYRIAYDIEQVVRELGTLGLPPIYAEMFRTGRKLN